MFTLKNIWSNCDQHYNPAQHISQNNLAVAAVFTLPFLFLMFNATLGFNGMDIMDLAYWLIKSIAYAFITMLLVKIFYCSQIVFKSSGYATFYTIITVCVLVGGAIQLSQKTLWGIESEILGTMVRFSMLYIVCLLARLPFALYLKGKTLHLENERYA